MNKKKKRKNDTRELEHICYLNKEEDVRMWNHLHHSDYNISCKKKK